MRDDARWMELALSLAARGAGRTSPNPPVGAVVVKGKKVMGCGYHRKAGTAHAEIHALRQAGVSSRGATLYVTLEPCSTTGRTPPCTEAVLAAGIRRVVVAATDPNPLHQGRGLRVLQRHGLEVCRGICTQQAEELIRPFACWVRHHRPMVTLKLGMSLDGRIADGAGASKWITGVAARREVQRLRSRVDAILVGSGTVLADDPALIPHNRSRHRPWRIVVDSTGTTVGLSRRLFEDPFVHRTILATTNLCPEPVRTELRRRGSTVWVLRKGAQGRVSLPCLMRKLGQYGVLHVLCEGGGRLAGSLIHARLVDEAWMYVAPRILGDSGTAAVAGFHTSLLRAPHWKLYDHVQCGEDICLRLRPHDEGAKTKRNNA